MLTKLQVEIAYILKEYGPHSLNGIKIYSLNDTHYWTIDFLDEHMAICGCHYISLEHGIGRLDPCCCTSGTIPEKEFLAQITQRAVNKFNRKKRNVKAV